MLVVYLPKEKLLIEADAFTPLPATAKLPPPAVPFAKTLADNLQRLKLDVAQIVPLHGPGVTTVQDLNSTIARSTSN
jgi:glyoxylase-like metal-dependent hydrolase (beta-lactamase superfamily II)